MWKYAYQVSENKKIRVIVHTDCKNEADDQFALAHHLMTPKFDVRGIVAGHFCKNPQEYGEENTAKASYDEVIRMMELMGIEGEYPVALGASKGMEDEQTPVESEGARFIIEEALKVDDCLSGSCYGCGICFADLSGNCRKDYDYLDRRSRLSEWRI